MYKTVIKIDGMMCGMCEAHICDCVRRTLPAKKVTASHGKGVCTFLSETPPDAAALKEAIGKTGYTVQSIDTVPADEKEGFFARLFKK
ncbi:MAG: ATPase P [Clostridia bacterium]|nr:MAG: ATPase P [Clostridia bacterium]